MKLTVIAIWSTLCALTANHPEPQQERETRLYSVAVDIHEQTQDIDEVDFMLAQGFGESRFAKNIQLGQCTRKWSCDVDKRTGLKRAHGFWQAWTNPAWHELWVAAETDVPSMVKLQLMMQRKLHSCGGDKVKAFSAFDGGGCKVTVRGKSRNELRKRIRSKLLREMAQ